MYYSLGFAVLGWIAIGVAIVLLLVCKQGMLRIVGWAECWPAVAA